MNKSKSMLLNIDTTNGTIQRPTLCIEPLKQEDGTYEPGRRAWTAVEFTSETDGDSQPFDILGNWTTFTLVVSPQESWEFHNANIAFARSTTLKRSNYIMIFEEAKRVI